VERHDVRIEEAKDERFAREQGDDEEDDQEWPPHADINAGSFTPTEFKHYLANIDDW
jgi:hypothetical protein